MFAELVAPEIAVGRALGDPVFVHVSKEVELAQGREEGADAWPRIGGHGGTGGGPSCGVWRGG